MEVWKDIPGIEYYQVSDLGNVRSIDRIIIGGRWGKEVRKGKVLKLGVDQDGYLHAGLSMGKKTVTKKVHRLVMLAFVGESILEVNHIDSNRKNNRLNNLEYVTSKENAIHSINAGRRNSVGENNPKARLTAVDILSMRKMKQEGQTLKQLGEKYGMDYRNISRIISGKQWRHLM